MKNTNDKIKERLLNLRAMDLFDGIFEHLLMANDDAMEVCYILTEQMFELTLYMDRMVKIEAYNYAAIARDEIKRKKDIYQAYLIKQGVTEEESLEMLNHTNQHFEEMKNEYIDDVMIDYFLGDDNEFDI